MRRVNFHPIHLHKLSHKEHIILSFILRDFGSSMVEFFVPIILVLNGYDVIWVGYFFLIEVATRLLCNLSIPRMFERIGVQNTLRVSHFLTIPYVAALAFVDASPWLIVVSGILSGITQTYYWIPRHIDIATVVSDRTVRSSAASRKQVGNLTIASTIASIIAPFLGGLITYYAGAQALMGVAFGLFIGASLVISQEAKNEMRHRRYRPKIHTALHSQNVRQFIGVAAVNFENRVASYLWPLFVFFTVDNIGTVGGILSLGNIVIVATIYLVTRSARPALYVVLGSIGRTLSFVLRIIGNTPLRVVGADMTGAAGIGAAGALFDDYYYKHANRDHDRQSNLIAGELIGNISKLVCWSIFTILLLRYSFAGAIEVMFILSAFITLFRMFIVPKEESIFTRS